AVAPPPAAPPVAAPVAAPAAAGLAAQDYQNALDYLESRPAPTYVEVDPNDTNSKDVLDGYITQLRYEYLEEVKATGENSDRSKQIASAMDAAFKQRANMEIIFPAALYLRSSYPSTSLQKEGFGVVGWDNMLTEQMFRQLPFFDLFRDGEKMRTLQ